MRKKVEDRIVTPKVIDIADEFSMFINQSTKRYKFYKKNKYQIEVVNQTPFPDTENNNDYKNIPTNLEFLD